MVKKIALGKGIASLLQETPNQILRSSLAEKDTKNDETELEKESIQQTESSSGYLSVSISDIITNPEQPRKIFDEAKIEELSNSIKENGIIQPLVVMKGEAGYTLIAGERRLRAAKKIGLGEVPVVFKKVTKKEQMVLAIIENVQRDDLNCVEEALAYYQLISELNLTQEEVAKKIGKSRAAISNLLRLLKLPRPVIEMLQKDLISLGHGKVLLGLDDESQIQSLADKVHQEGLSVRELEKRVKFIINCRNGSSPQESKANDPELDSSVKYLEEKLSSKLGTKVRLKLKDTNGKGTLQFAYKSKEDFNRMYDLLMNL